MYTYTKEFVGCLPTGQEIFAHTVSNGLLSATVIDYGATLQKLVHRGRDIVCGYDRVEAYVRAEGCVGATVGRYANRISGGKLTIDGVDYPIARNNGEAHLHGGAVGFDKRYWYVEDGITHEGFPCLCCGYISQDGEEGYPGRMTVSVNYILKGETLLIDYKGATNRPTYCNLTNHSYFNLNGYDQPTVLNHKLTVFADAYTEVDPNTLLPTGRRLPVAGTAFDFRTEKAIGEAFEKTGLPYPGYDHNFVLDPHADSCTYEGLTLRCAAICRVPDRQVKIYTSKPCMQVYTANFLGDGPDFKGGVKQVKYHGVCFETQYEPDSPTQGRALLTPACPYHHATSFRFAQVED